MSNTSFLQMSFIAGILIIAILVLRKLFIRIIPMKAFMALWWVVICRLLLPFSLSLPFGVSSSETLERTSRILVPSAQPTGNMEMVQSISPPLEVPMKISQWAIIWGMGVLLTATYFIISYTRLRHKFSQSVEICDIHIDRWLADHLLRREIKVRVSTYVATPLTYGVFRPVILLPFDMNYKDMAKMQHILLHEYTHIRRFDAITKVLLVLCLCLHWFNPLVWAMYMLANRDIELSCDEAVLRQNSGIPKAEYALTLIDMASNNKTGTLLCNGFCKCAVEERIVIIMKMKKQSVIGATLAFLMVASATSAFAAEPEAVVVTAATAQFSTVDEAMAVNALGGGDVELVDGIVEYDPGVLDNDDGVAPLASGDLAAGKAYTYDSQSMSKGQKVTINIDYTPTSSSMRIGLKSSSGTIYFTTVTGGSGSATFSVNKNDTYSIYVGNPSSVSVDFDVSYIVN